MQLFEGKDYFISPKFLSLWCNPGKSLYWLTQEKLFRAYVYEANTIVDITWDDTQFVGTLGSSYYYLTKKNGSKVLSIFIQENENIRMATVWEIKDKLKKIDTIGAIKTDEGTTHVIIDQWGGEYILSDYESISSPQIYGKNSYFSFLQWAKYGVGIVKWWVWSEFLPANTTNKP